jgi:hypothetical protein
LSYSWEEGKSVYMDPHVPVILKEYPTFLSELDEETGRLVQTITEGISDGMKERGNIGVNWRFCLKIYF